MADYFIGGEKVSIMFEASNGIKIGAPHLGYLQWEGKYTEGDMGYALNSGVGRATAEFFQAQRDKELGRWRSKENPDWVVYPSRREGTHGKGRAIQVYSETLNKVWDVLETSPVNRIRTGIHLDVAREWFKAHPVPKPTYWEQFKAFDVGTKFTIFDAVECVKTGDNQLVLIDAALPAKYFGDVESELGSWKDYTGKLSATR